jgi:hypothetical protein
MGVELIEKEISWFSYAFLVCLICFSRTKIPLENSNFFYVYNFALSIQNLYERKKNTSMKLLEKKIEENFLNQIPWGL